MPKTNDCRALGPTRHLRARDARPRSGTGALLRAGEAAGVEAVFWARVRSWWGRDVTSFRAGDRVFGYTEGPFGAHAEYLVIGEDALVAAVPANLSYKRAAAPDRIRR